MPTRDCRSSYVAAAANLLLLLLLPVSNRGESLRSDQYTFIHSSKGKARAGTYARPDNRLRCSTSLILWCFLIVPMLVECVSCKHTTIVLSLYQYTVGSQPTSIARTFRILRQVIVLASRCFLAERQPLMTCILWIPRNKPRASVSLVVTRDNHRADSKEDPSSCVYRMITREHSIDFEIDSHQRIGKEQDHSPTRFYILHHPRHPPLQYRQRKSYVSCQGSNQSS